MLLYPWGTEMRTQLTDRFCHNVKSPTARVDYFDNKTPGLCLRVTPNGAKSFTLHFTANDGKRARLTLGRYPRVSLARARSLALEALGGLQEGQDPRHGGAGTVGDLAEVYLAEHVRPNLRSAKTFERRLRKNVLPIIGGVLLADLHKRDVNRVVSPILRRKKRVEAARVFEDRRGMLRWGTARGDLDRSPTEGMRSPTTPAPRERVLSDDEIATLWRGLPKALPRSPTVQNIIKLCLLTGQRVGEVAGIQAGELDAKQRLWTIPVARSKNKHAHTVPLTDPAFALSEIIAANDKLPGHAVAKIIRRAQDHFGIEPWTAHDLRRSVVTHMAELGVEPIVLANVVNHRSVSKAGVTLSVYAKYDYAKEKREALSLWADRLAAIVGRATAKVLPIRGKG